MAHMRLFIPTMRFPEPCRSKAVAAPPLAGGVMTVHNWGNGV